MIALNTEIPIITDRVEKDAYIFLNQIKVCIKLKGSEPSFGVKSLAKFLRLSSTQLNRKLMHLTGYSPGKLIKHYRMHMAKQLLLESQETVKQIAWQCGFQRHASFCRSFCLEFRCTPSQYRSRNQGNHNGKPFHWKIPLGGQDFENLLQLAYQKPWLAQLLLTVLPNLGKENFTVDQLAASLYLSTSSLHRKIKETFEVTPQRLIRDLKLQYASELLVARFESIAEVANKAGFFDHAHFCRCFKSAFNCSPTAFNRENGNETSLAWLRSKLKAQNGK
jgi:AraC-like DNA-binding protein